MRAEVFRSKDEWRFRIVGDNGEVVAQSEGYSRRIDAVETATGLIPEGAEIITDEESDG